jgi:CubicO group peptidase (beta-lactamase class C family)
MKKNYMLILLTLAAACTQLPHQDQVYTKDIEDKISQVETHLCASPADSNAWTLSDRMKYYQVEGLSIAVVHNFEVEWARGYGWADVSEHRPVTTRTLFQAGSISKSLNAVGVMLLVQRHQLDLNADINTYLKGWKFPYDSVPKGRKITLGNLLSHTGGLSIHGFPGYVRGDSIPTVEEILDGKKPANTGAVRSIAEPGTKFIYSGGGITISQLIAHDVTGQPYAGFMAHDVLQPMGMVNSSYTQPPPESPDRATDRATDRPTDRATGYLRGDAVVPGKYHIYPEQAAAGLWTTPTDLGKYIVETQLAYEGKSTKVLDQATTRTRLSPYIDSIDASGTRTGMGVFLFQRGGRHYFNHNGSDVGFLSSYYGCLESGDGVVVMINNDINNTLLKEVINSVARVYHWEGFTLPF